ncbi:MAG: ATP-binding protein [SAR324 cluster bacterium]|nr:ATP-binding protein [SAR324 cluster bacterium]
MLSLKKIKLTEMLLIGATLASVVLLNWFSTSVEKKYSDVNVVWAVYIGEESKVIENLFLVKGYFGYGGIIHNFKNYVLRGDAKYLTRFTINTVDLSESIEDLKIYLKTKEELAALADIEKTIEEYKAKTALVTLLHKKKLNIQAIDKLVYVEDAQALAALKLLTHKSLERAQEIKSQANAKMIMAHQFLKIGKFAQIPLILLVMAIIVILRRLNITKENALEAQVWADTLLETAPDAIICANPEGHILRSNAMAEKIFGYSKSEFFSLKIEDLVPKPHRPNHHEKRADYHAHPTSRPMGSGRRLAALNKLGNELPVEISLSSMEIKGDKIAIASIRDVTEQEIAKQNLISAKKEVEHALELLKSTTDSLVESEKQAATGQLVAGVAHEINTPIGICLSASTHLRAETLKSAKSYNEGDLSGDELEDYFKTSDEATGLINSNLERAARQIQSFKQVAVDQSGGEQRKFSLKTYVEEILVSLNSIIKKSKVVIELNISDELFMETYPGAIFQFLSNLVINAITHAFDQNQEGTLEISAKHMEGTEMVTLEIKDNGKGIAPENQKKIFDPFFTTRRGAGGSGLGMSIVKKIVTHNLGGDITFVSKQGEGTTFVVTLPQHFKLV